MICQSNEFDPALPIDFWWLKTLITITEIIYVSVASYLDLEYLEIRF